MSDDDISIQDALAVFGVRHERDAKTDGNGKHSLFDMTGFIGRMDAHEASQLLRDLREPATP